MFARFYQREKAAGEVTAQGSWLGLAIARSLAARHGARVDLATSPLGELRAQVRFGRQT